MSFVKFKNVYKRYKMGEITINAADGVSFEIEKGEFAVIVGASGAGKTTILNMLGGMDTCDEGKILVDGKDIATFNKKQLTTYRRYDIGFVFQFYNLVNNLTAKENVELATQICAHASKPEEVLKKVGLEDRMNNFPSQLSGGEQQRVAIARTLAPEPTVLFMDEPLSNLDAKLRLEMRYELQRLHVETGSTFVYVTHDQMEAMTLATQICLINNGVLQQYEAPLDVYHHPANLFVADFVGNPSINFVEVKGRQAADGTISMTMLGGVQATFRPKKPVELAAWFADRDRSEEEKAAALREKAKEKGYVEKGNKDEVFRYHIAKVDEEDDSLQDAPEITNEDLVLGIRPEFLDIADSSNLRGEIYGAMPTGMESTIKVRVGGFLLTGVIFGSSLFTIGSEVPLSVTGDQIMLFDRKSGRCITSGSLTF